MSQQFFAQVAEQWDSLRATMYSDAVRDAAIAQAALRPEMIVADVGAGTGFIAQGLAPLVAKVYALDNSPEMLDVARRNLSAFQNVEFRLADAATIPLPDASVDAAFANMYLHHAPDPAAAIREMARLLKPHGRLVITDSDKHEHAWLRQEHADLWLGFDRAQVREWFEAAGLVNVLVDCTGETCCAESQAQKGQAAISIFLAVGTKPDTRMTESVQQTYRAIATGQSSGGGCSDSQPSDCCGSSGNTGLKETSDSMQRISLLSVPSHVLRSIRLIIRSILKSDVPTLSLGCGNPVAAASLKPGEVVLDIGSGAGADVFPAAQKVGPTGIVIGLDMLPEMLERARRTAQDAGYTNVEFRQGDALAMPVEDNSVDVVMSNCVINLVLDKGKAFREAHRVLKPGGRLAISDIVTDRPFSPALRADVKSWVSCVSGALAEAEYVALIKQAGFDDVQLARSMAFPAEDGTRVYSLHVTARKKGK